MNKDFETLARLGQGQVLAKTEAALASVADKVVRDGGAGLKIGFTVPGLESLWWKAFRGVCAQVAGRLEVPVFV